MVLYWNEWESSVILGDMLNADGGVDSAVVARIRCGRNKVSRAGSYIDP